MSRDEFSEMRAFLEVARERSFTRAAAKLGVTRSALSHTVRALEERLGIRLLSRTTRDVAPTAAGERLVECIEPHFESIAAEISAISALRDKPAGHIRIVCPDDAIGMVFRPRLPAFLRDYPDIKVELIADNGLRISSSASLMPAFGLARQSRATWWQLGSVPMSAMPWSAHPIISGVIPRRAARRN